MPPKDHPVWKVATILSVGVVVLVMATFGTQNGFSWKTDIPALLAIISTIAGIQFTQSRAPE